MALRASNSNSDKDNMNQVLKTVERILTGDKTDFDTDKSSAVVETPCQINNLQGPVIVNVRNNEETHQSSDRSMCENNSQTVTLADARVIHCTDGNFYQKYGFAKKRKIGNGASGEVFEVCLRTDPSVVRALKVFYFNNKKYEFEYVQKLFMKEVSILQSIEHRHILHGCTAYHCIDYGVLEMDLYREGNLRQVLALRPRLMLDHYFLQIAGAVRYLHEQRIVHRDIKLDNVLVSGENSVLIDFGFAERLSNGNTLQGRRGTKPYLAPEVRYGERDVQFDAVQNEAYSVGVLLWALLTRRIPTSDMKFRRALKDYREMIDARIYRAAFLLLRSDPLERFSVERVLCYLHDQEWNADLIDKL